MVHDVLIDNLQFYISRLNTGFMQYIKIYKKSAVSSITQCTLYQCKVPIKVLNEAILYSSNNIAKQEEEDHTTKLWQYTENKIIIRQANWNQTTNTNVCLRVRAFKSVPTYRIFERKSFCMKLHFRIFRSQKCFRSPVSWVKTHRKFWARFCCWERL